MKSHEFAKLINSNNYLHLAKIHPLPFTLGIYPRFTLDLPPFLRYSYFLYRFLVFFQHD